MISLHLARQLQQAGLIWHPAERDTFAIPDRHMDQQTFVISQLTALVQVYNSNPVVTFHGSSEWALDYVLLSDVVWLPTETQLRAALADRIGETAPLSLDRTREGYCCRIMYRDRMLEFTAAEGETAYALALLYVLKAEQQP